MISVKYSKYIVLLVLLGCSGGDATSLAEAVITLLRDPKKRQQLGASARSFVKANYNWEFVRQRISAIQETVWSTRGETF